MGLATKEHRLPNKLSGGEQQRVAIARALIMRPKYIFADEPTGNVDPDIGARIIRLFIELNRLGTCVLIATHDQRILERVPASGIFRLAEGQLGLTTPRDLEALEARRA
jgi:cell division transport system ATP-binding protein